MRRDLVFLLLVIFGNAYGGLPSIPDPDIRKFQQTREEGSHRLPGHTIPKRYEIDLEPNFQDYTFEGRVAIDIVVVTATDIITMHANELDNFSDVTITIGDDTTPLENDDVKTDETDLQFLTIQLPTTLAVGTELTLSMRYTGKLNEDNKGFYRAHYVENGETKWFAMTQFEQTYARQAFPCYDEPGIKATFKISIIRSEPYYSISNMEQDGDPVPSGDKFIDNFIETVPMSTYLVAFVVSEMGHTEVESNQAVYAAKYLIDDGRGEYGLRVGIATLQAMEDYTEHPYTLSKMFQVGVPNDYFTFGAMENWGLVIYRERLLLYKEGITTAAEEQGVASIIAHEYAHQWFGNLVSPSWWKYIWLNEGFATYFEYYACDVVNSDMRMMEQYVTMVVQNAMEADATENTREMSYDAQIPSDITALFDRIAYDKSGSVIRMMEHILTSEVFRRGLIIYLNNMEDDVADSSDLWSAIQEAVEESDTDPFGGRTVEDVMGTWELLPGFPVITATRGEGKITIEQERYYTNQPSTSDSAIWSIPINYATASNLDFNDTTAQYWLTAASQEFDIAVDDEDWFILNKQETGYYRVNYDEDNWNLLIDYLNSANYNRVHLLNRAQLVDDSLNLARSGRLNYNTTMNLLLYLKRETNYIPLYSFFRGMTYLYKFILPTEQYDIFKDYMKEILQAAYTTLGTDASRDSHTDKLNRINVLTWLCRVDHVACVELMNTQLTALLSEEPPAVSPDLQTLVYCSGQRDTDRAEEKLEYLVGRYLADEAEELEKTRILNAIGCSTSEIILNRVLDIATGKDETLSFTTTTAIVNAFSSVYTQSEVGLQVALDYIIENFEDMDAGFTTEEISPILTGIADRLTSQELADKLNAFVDGLSTELQTKYSEAIGSAKSTMETNLAWSEEHLEQITDFLIVYGNGYVFAISIPLLILTLLSHIFV